MYIYIYSVWLRCKLNARLKWNLKWHRREWAKRPENTSLVRVYIQIIRTHISFHIFSSISLYEQKYFQLKLHAGMEKKTPGDKKKKQTLIFPFKLTISLVNCARKLANPKCGHKVFDRCARWWSYICSNSSSFLSYLITTLHNFARDCNRAWVMITNIPPPRAPRTVYGPGTCYRGHIYIQPMWFRVCVFFRPSRKSSMRLLIAI